MTRALWPYGVRLGNLNPRRSGAFVGDGIDCRFRQKPYVLASLLLSVAGFGGCVRSAAALAPCTVRPENVAEVVVGGEVLVGGMFLFRGVFL